LPRRRAALDGRLKGGHDGFGWINLTAGLSRTLADELGESTDDASDIVLGHADE
jgi:hypothetical protein